MAQKGLAWLDGWCDVVGCPLCHGALAPGDGFCCACSVCGARFAANGQTPALVQQDKVSTFDAFGCVYRQARLQEGWRPLTPGQALDLPCSSPPGYPPLYWAVRCQSYRRLRQFLAQEGADPAAGPVADLGAGIGWLSYRLAQAGYRALAVDGSLDEDFGLGATRAYVSASRGRLLAVQADLEQPPLRERCWSLVVFNASLHYARDLKATLCRAASALQGGGRIVILDVPIASQPVAGTGRGDRHLGRRELEQALVAAGLQPRWFHISRGVRWHAHQVKAWLRQRPLFSFPMVVGDCP